MRFPNYYQILTNFFECFDPHARGGYFRCVLESMKMELVLSAPQDCVVQQWLVTAGDSVTEGQVVTCRARDLCMHH